MDDSTACYAPNKSRPYAIATTAAHGFGNGDRNIAMKTLPGADIDNGARR
ncbi:MULTISPECIES: hypothetical protein [Lysobacter]|jgi:hypothetical protein|uniref:Uncharacterized protein n=1 Tax=Lysobacter gummosus TaxID=262324 RepID=A0ABY3X5D8_9GAMM|nr:MULTISPECIES: hypothetical protein [Lysobacter]ALN92162.1 hypothetical protein LG3211_3207 [Lysobacter gummosus]UJB20892.1 hypothetical protein L1A79_07450 [Lysobacter capsici]UJQ29994.1 hypothetical protein L2D09_07410 [Lysobacter gummosus]UNP27783.1 hypothetical protein MOV92_14830 [Lysobacter gummosus]